MQPKLSRAIKFFILALVVVAPIEICSYVVAQILIGRGAIFSPPRNVDYAGYLEIRDPLLGWPAPESIGSGEFDSAGSRIVPSFPNPNLTPCVELFGDSFTWGAEVTPDQAWGNLLSRQMNCRVANYGIGGYGTDQAFLRYRDRIDGQAPVVVLGYWSENIIRNVNRYRGFLPRGPINGFKPRFTANGPDLELSLIPMPSPSDDRFSVLDIRDDWFAPGAGGGVEIASFPFTLAVVKSLGYFKISAALRREASFAQFYDPSHASDAFQTTFSIMRAFSAEAIRRNQRGFVLLVPSDFDLEALRSNGATYYESLVSLLKRDGIEALDTAPLFLSDLAERPACEIYIECGGHLSPEGNAWLAGYVYDYLSVGEDETITTNP